MTGAAPYHALGAHEMELICAGGEDLTRGQPMPLDLTGLGRRAKEFTATDIDLAWQRDGELSDAD